MFYVAHIKHLVYLCPMFKNKLFARDLKIHRKSIGLSLRGAQSKSKISFATLSRLENGSEPELKHFILACKWMNKELATYVK